MKLRTDQIASVAREIRNRVGRQPGQLVLVSGSGKFHRPIDSIGGVNGDPRPVVRGKNGMVYLPHDDEKLDAVLDTILTEREFADVNATDTQAIWDTLAKMSGKPIVPANE